MPAEIRITERHWTQLRAHLLADDREHAAVLMAGAAQVGGDPILLVRELVPLGEPDLLASSDLHLEVSPVSLARLLKRASLDGTSIIVCHSHPFPGPVGPSSIDLATERELCGRVASLRLDGRPVGALILGPDGASGRVWGNGRPAAAVVRIVGGSVRVLQPMPPAEIAEEPAPSFARQMLLWGRGGQDRLGTAKAVVVGAGGTGSHVAQQLAHLGIGELAIVDPDVLETSNLSRVVGSTTDDVGAAKVEVAARAARAVRPDIRVVTIEASVLDIDPTPLIGADVIACCTDGHGSRALLNELVQQYLVPVVDVGIEVQPGEVSSRAGGGVRVLRPGRPCLQCMRVLDPGLVREELLSDTERLRELELGYLRGGQIAAPAVVALNGVVASLAVTEICDLLIGLFASSPDRLIYRAETRAVASVGSGADGSCYVCGTDGLLGRGDSRSLPRRRQPRAS
jgi:molybdopterin/thiamine biosynthesis adenylyltransferase